MSLDGVMVYGLVCELKCLKERRIEKIHQPSSMELVFQIRGGLRLYISASPDRARINLTKRRFENPKSPPMFSMLLRKHLLGGKIIDIRQEGMDRILYIDIENYDELGNLSIKTIACELTGKSSNIILIKDGYIIDAIRRVYSDMSEREILPNLKYEPKESDKELIFNLSEDFFNVDTENISIKNFLINSFEGFGPRTAFELTSRANLNDNLGINDLTHEEILRLYKVIEDFKKELIEENFHPNIVYDEKKVIAFSIYPLRQFEGLLEKSFSSISEMLEEVYTTKDTIDLIKNHSTHLRKVVSNNIKKLERKLKKQKTELIDAREREKYKIYADLIQANLNLPYNNETWIRVINYYDENLSEIEIPLDNKLNLVRNSQKYYKLFQKLKNREALLSKEIPKVEREKKYLEQILLSLEQVSLVGELEEIREELEEEGYLKAQSKKKKLKKSMPLSYRSSEGFIIFVGKNNRQNDNLTFKIAKSDDIWMHIKELPGSHVIIHSEGRIVPDKTIEEGAYLAKKFSQGKGLSHAEVDYTLKKNVRRMKGGKLGMVNYYEYQTIYVSDSETIGERLTEIN